MLIHCLKRNSLVWPVAKQLTQQLRYSNLSDSIWKKAAKNDSLIKYESFIPDSMRKGKARMLSTKQLLLKQHCR
jgi:hypothetical protein